MSKTALTLDLERTLYAYWEELGAVAVEEVTMPDDQGIVDTLVRQQDETGTTWRCFELKVTKADFHSSAALSFVGHYNYFVLPTKLYQQVTSEIPAGIGVMTYAPYTAALMAATLLPPAAPGQLTVARKPTRQALQVPEAALCDRFIASLNREVQKAKRAARGPRAFSDDELMRELRRRGSDYAVYDPAANLYDRFFGELSDTTVATLQEEVDALAAELALAKLKAAGA
ncbi:hypothetical protein [Lacticaseibacillus parakribbianus]|uniref:hypothetical protein n=1 Tax=Lacticaseibacillus parakribbianus TaxID=2970927 RepID=UPI0021CB9179|nr:hypothetical protein [Lacticaseibacillus parakribbianus]